MRRLALAPLLLLAACAARGPVAAAPAAGTGCVPAGRWVDPETRAVVAPATVVARAADATVVLLGERHERADDHRWQLQTLAALQASHPELVVGFEMFPRRVQPALDAWTAGTLDERAFLVASDWSAVWGFDPALYLPLFHFARLNGVPMRALNVSRALVGRVGDAGFAAVPEAEREGVGTPAPATPAYAAFLQSVFDAHGDATPPDDPARTRFVEAQLTWDRAMAEALADAHRARPDALVVGVMGSGHVERRWGVPYQLGALGVARVVTMVPWDAGRDCAELTADVADYVFGVPAAATQPPPPRLGVLLEPADGGVRIRDVTPDGLAATSGLRAGDVVVAAAGRPVDGAGALRSVVEATAPGTWLPLEIRRGRARKRIVVHFPPAAP